MEEQKELVYSPEGAALLVIGDLSDGGDISAALAITVHGVGEDSVCNFWERQECVWKKILPERVVEKTRPKQSMLHGEINRFFDTNRAIIESDPHIKFALVRLQYQLLFFHGEP